MNTILASQRLGRLLAVPDPFNLPADAALDVFSAINAALTDFYGHIPRRFRSQEISATIPAPIQLFLTFTDAVTVQGTPFLSIQKGCTVQVESQAFDNQITGTNSVRDAYMLYNITPTAQATIYHDAVALEATVDEIMSDVTLYHAGSSTGTPLQPIERRERWRGIAERGIPRTYEMRHFPIARGEAPGQFLRLHPAPVAECMVAFVALVTPKRLTFAEFETGAGIPVLAQHIEEFFLPLAEAHLTRSNLWQGSRSKVRVLELAGQIRNEFLPRLSETSAPVRRKVGTPHGF